MEIITHKGYSGSVQVDMEGGFLHGQILFINDLVTYEGGTPKELKEAFSAAVDDYLELCAEMEKTPEKPFSGQFNVRVGESLHKRAALRATRDEIKLNQVMVRALECYLDDTTHHNHVHTHEVTVKMETVYNASAALSQPMQFLDVKSTHEQAPTRH